jgi:hypothetical protein
MRYTYRLFVLFFIMLTLMAGAYAPAVMAQAAKGSLSVLNQTRSPKLFLIERIAADTTTVLAANPKPAFKLKVTLAGNKEYFLDPGLYQITYYAALQASQVSRRFEIRASRKTRVIFYKTGKYRADFEIR